MWQRLRCLLTLLTSRWCTLALPHVSPPTHPPHTPGTSFIRAFDGIRHLVIFAFMLLYLFTMHGLRLYNDYMGWTLDITGPLMLLTIKVRRRLRVRALVLDRVP